MLNESVIKVLKNEMWDLATCANGEPNVVPVEFKEVTEEGKLEIPSRKWSKRCFRERQRQREHLLLHLPK